MYGKRRTLKNFETILFERRYRKIRKSNRFCNRKTQRSGSKIWRRVYHTPLESCGFFGGLGNGYRLSCGWSFT